VADDKTEYDQLKSFILKSMFRILFLCCLVLSTGHVYAQPGRYTTANAHSHNNYEQAVPFWEAYNLQYGSIEADVFLSADSNDLWVAHALRDLDVKKQSLDSLYLRPLADCIKKNDGYVYADHSRRLQLMIDIKSSAVPTLNRLIAMIKKYPGLAGNSSIRFVISGNRPEPSAFDSYPSFIWFDGNAGVDYNAAALSKIAMMSAPFTQYSKWTGQGAMPQEDESKIRQLVDKAHIDKKPIRFWATPDNPDAWKVLMKLKIDFINTDHVGQLADYLRAR